MKIVKKSYILNFILLLMVGGCEQGSNIKSTDATRQLEQYGPVTVSIVGLSELSPVPGAAGSGRLKLFVRPLDTFGSAVKWPCIFRIEMYDYVERAPSPMGRRIEIWPDVNLIDPCKNNAQWRDYLRAYEFNFDVSPKLASGRVYIVEVTCQSPSGKRMTAQHNFKF
jgi:hypothetical protein